MGKFLVIIPAFNEASVIGNTIQGVRHSLKEAKILVVNDGSSDTTGIEAVKAGATVVSHPINRGLGGALGTGLYWAKIRDVDYVVTFDADGQHDPDDILKVLSPIISSSADVVIGTRTKFGWGEIPWDRKIVLTLSNWLTWWLFGIKTTDSTSGLRAFNREAVEKIQIKTDQMEVSNEFFYEIKDVN